MHDNRLKNDEITSDRRELKDGNLGMALEVSLVILLVLAIGAYFIFI